MPGAASLEELPPWARGLLQTERVGHLGLLDDDGQPRVLPVTFAVVDDEIWSAVDEKPKRVPGTKLARIRWLRARPSSALTVDRYSDDWSKLAWVQLIGTTTVVEAAGQARVLDALSARYAPYRERPPRGPLLRMTPERCVWWRAQP
ncbi:MAG: pyridoxamine 5'-phosphate oxidase family protein [Solirubrobacterales bacterium]